MEELEVLESKAVDFVQLLNTRIHSIMKDAARGYVLFF